MENLLQHSLFYILLLSATQLVLVMIQDPPVLIQIVRVAIGAPFVLFFPGYCLMAAAFPAKDELEGKARITLSLGLSLVLLPSLVLVLDTLPWGITLGSVILGLLMLILLLAVFTVLRQRALPPKDRFEPLQEVHLRQAWRGLEQRYQAAAVIIVLLVISFSLLAYSILALPSPADLMTEFYILGDGGMAEGYPYHLISGQPAQITIGVRNLEGRSHIFHIIASDRSGRIGAAEPFLLQDQELTEFALTLTPVETGSDVRIHFELFIDDRVDPYRSLRLYIRVLTAD